MDITEVYQQHWDRRTAYSKKVLDSTELKKLVMAGPGTGKSHLFQELAKKYIEEGKPKILVLSFINELVKDLTIDMHGLAEVSTLHSFAAKQLRNRQKIYMDLLKVIESDYSIESATPKNFAKILHKLEAGEDETLAYLKKRRNYYSCFDPASMVYELLKYYSQDANIPQYDLIMVDEYQDFNKLEIELIDLLSTKSHILIAGDDDQSLYSFKHAEPDNIRELYTTDGYKSFELPYCSRSTKVVIDAFHDVVNKAKSEGFIGQRIEKEYIYFPNKEKDEISASNPKIIVTRNMYQSQSAYFIDTEIKNIFKKDPKFDILIVCSLKSQILPLATALKKMGYSNISNDEPFPEEYVQLADGLGYLVEDKSSNLAWRLCAQVLIDDADVYKEALLKSADCSQPFSECVSNQIKQEIKKLRAACVRLSQGTPLSGEQRELLFTRLGVVPKKLGEKLAKDMIFANTSKNILGNTKIKLTTILGSKGLSYDYVFMVNFDDRFLIPAGGLSDESINKFLVALTRSRKKIYIYSSQISEPKFVTWIEAEKKVSTVLEFTRGRT